MTDEPSQKSSPDSQEEQAIIICNGCGLRVSYPISDPNPICPACDYPLLFKNKSK